MTVPAVLAIAGVAVLLLGILGGGVKIREIEIPTMPRIGRLFAAVAGLALIGTAIWLSVSQGQLPVSLGPTSTPQANDGTITPATATAALTAPDPKRIYLIRSKLSQKVLDFDGMSIIQAEWTSQTHQEWTFEPLHGVDEGYYAIHSAQTGDCMDVRGGTLDDAGEILLYGCTGADNQKWRITEAESGAVYLQAKHSGKVLDLPGGNTESGIHLIQWHYQGSENQQWILTPVTP